MVGTAILWSVALAFVAAAAIWDLRTGHIPNRLTFAGLGAGAILHVLVRTLAPAPDAPLSLSVFAISATSALLGILVCSAVPYFLFLRNAMGGGDVKLLAAVGAFLGPVSGLQVELYSFIAMAIFVPVRLAYEGRLLQMLGHSLTIMVHPLLPKSRRREIDVEQLTMHKFGPAVLAAMALVTVLRWSTP